MFVCGQVNGEVPGTFPLTSAHSTYYHQCLTLAAISQQVKSLSREVRECELPSACTTPPPPQILARALLDCHEEAKKAGSRLALEVFVAGRNRLEDQGAAAFSEVFEVRFVKRLLRVDTPDQR